MKVHKSACHWKIFLTDRVSGSVWHSIFCRQDPFILFRFESFSMFLSISLLCFCSVSLWSLSLLIFSHVSFLLSLAFFDFLSCSLAVSGVAFWPRHIASSDLACSTPHYLPRDASIFVGSCSFCRHPLQVTCNADDNFALDRVVSLFHCKTHHMACSRIRREPELPNCSHNDKLFVFNQSLSPSKTSDDPKPLSMALAIKKRLLLAPVYIPKAIVSILVVRLSLLPALTFILSNAAKVRDKANFCDTN